MDEYIERSEIQAAMKSVTDDTTCPLHIAAEIDQILSLTPTADVRLERHGHIVWKERHCGGFRQEKCLTDIGYTIFRVPCNKIARIDTRTIERRPYCSKCGKLLGDFLNYCGNCGAKMDRKK